MPSVTTRLIFFLVLPAAGLLMVYPLLFDRTARTLAGTGIGTRALTTQWQAAAMAQAAVTAQIHQPLDRHADLATQVAFDHEFRDFGAQTLDFRLAQRSEEHTSELQSLMRISYAVFCLKKKKTNIENELKQHLHTRNTKTHQ